MLSFPASSLYSGFGGSKLVRLIHHFISHSSSFGHP
uniref:Uncharacterized protein n=1 Tax=Arundo donax TaxID=35708 RepID=A0A0A9EMF5_ARUDO